MPGQVLQGRSRDGSLRPAVFPDGVDAAIARHQASSSAGPSVAARPPPRHLYGGAAAAPISSVPSGRGLLGGATPLLSGRGATEDPQVHRDREFAMKLAHEPSAELPPAIVAAAPAHSRMLADRLQRARHRGQSTYPYVSPVFFLALLGGANHVPCSAACFPMQGCLHASFWARPLDAGVRRRAVLLPAKSENVRRAA